MIISIKEATDNVKKFSDEILADQHGRYRSWEHCYNAFSKNRHKYDEETLDYLSLHLAFYLASWGMYRGSSFLLQKDYKVHRKVVETIFDEQYDCLFAIEAQELLKDERLNLLFEVSEEIKKIYAGTKSVKESKENNATDTLITKILLGTFGCVPAYDQYFLKGISKHNIAKQTYGKDSIKALASYYLEHYEEFENVREEISSYGITYTPMKIIDMCFWQIGIDSVNNLNS